MPRVTLPYRQIEKHYPVGLKNMTLSAGVGTDVERQLAIQGDGLAVGSGLSIYPAANAAILDATLNGDFETNTTGWTNNAAGGVISRITTDAKFGSACIQTVNDGTGANQGPVTDALTGLTAGNVYTAGLHIRSVSGATAIRVQIEWYTVLDVIISSTISDITITSVWQRYVLTGTAPALGVHAKIGVINLAATAATYNIDGVQFDNGPVALPFDPANTRVAGTVQLTAAGLLTATQGWRATWCRPRWSNTAEPPNPRVQNWTGGGGGITTLYAGGSNVWEMDNDESGGVAAQSVTVAGTVTSGDLYLVVSQWQSGNFGLSINGAVPTMMGSRTEIPASLGTSLEIGYDSTVASRQINGEVLCELVGKGIPSNADIARMETWRAAGIIPTLDQIKQLSLASKPTALINGKDANVITLPAFFESR